MTVEPIEDSNDLFGATVQTAARICREATAGAVVISQAVRAALEEDFPLTTLAPRALKGLPGRVRLYEVAWH